MRNRVVLSKLPHLGIPEHHLCRAIHILSHNRYLARAKSAVLLSVDELMIDMQVRGLLKNNFQDIINLFPAKEWSYVRYKQETG